MNRIKPVISLGIICILTIVITGCNLFRKDTKTDTDVSRAKDSMLEKLDNYSMEVTITSKTSIADVQIKMFCTKDIKNKIDYCRTSTLGIAESEQYIDYKNNKSYTKSKDYLSVDEDNWKVKDIKDNYENVWIGINDYLKNIEVTNTSGGKIYKGTISIKKITDAISKTDTTTSIKIPTIANKDIPIEVFINKKGYIENIKTSFDFVGINEVIEVKYYNYDGNKGLVLPKV